MMRTLISVHPKCKLTFLLGKPMPLATTMNIVASARGPIDVGHEGARNIHACFF